MATTRRTASARAAAVSRVLARAGLRPLPSGTPRTREGIRVTRSVLGQVNVTVDLDRHQAILTAMVHEALVDAGYTVEARGTWNMEAQGTILTVTHPGWEDAAG